jgi:hypothetical protein
MRRNRFLLYDREPINIAVPQTGDPGSPSTHRFEAETVNDPLSVHETFEGAAAEARRRLIGEPDKTFFLADDAGRVYRTFADQREQLKLIRSTKRRAFFGWIAFLGFVDLAASLTTDVGLWGLLVFPMVVGLWWLMVITGFQNEIEGAILAFIIQIMLLLLAHAIVHTQQLKASARATSTAHPMSRTGGN